MSTINTNLPQQILTKDPFYKWLRQRSTEVPTLSVHSQDAASTEAALYFSSTCIAHRSGDHYSSFPRAPLRKSTRFPSQSTVHPLIVTSAKPGHRGHPLAQHLPPFWLKKQAPTHRRNLDQKILIGSSKHTVLLQFSCLTSSQCCLRELSHHAWKNNLNDSEEESNGESATCTVRTTGVDVTETAQRQKRRTHSFPNCKQIHREAENFKICF